MPSKTKKKSKKQPILVDFKSNEESHEYKMQKVKIAQDKMDANTFAIHGNIPDELFQKIVSKLKPNQWLHSTETKDLTISGLDDVKETEEFVVKPDGLYFSKGDWLFFGYSYSENEIYIADVDYSKIKVVADENDLFDFIQKYVSTRRLVNKLNLNFYKKKVMRVFVFYPIQEFFCEN